MATPFVGFLSCWWIFSFPAPLPGCCGAPVASCRGCVYSCSCFLARVALETWVCYRWGCILPFVLRFVVREEWYVSEQVCWHNSLQFVIPSCNLFMLVFCCLFTVIIVSFLSLLLIYGLRVVIKFDSLHSVVLLEQSEAFRSILFSYLYFVPLIV